MILELSNTEWIRINDVYSVEDIVQEFHCAIDWDWKNGYYVKIDFPNEIHYTKFLLKFSHIL